MKNKHFSTYLFLYVIDYMFCFIFIKNKSVSLNIHSFNVCYPTVFDLKANLLRYICEDMIKWPITVPK